MHFSQRFAHPRDRLRSILAPHNQLGDHRIVKRRDLVTGADAGVDPNGSRPVERFAVRVAREGNVLRRCVVSQTPGRRQEARVRIFGVDPRLEGMAGDRERLLQFRQHRGQRLTGRHTQLPLDQIMAADHLGHRVLDLQPRVHLHEEEVALRIGDEFNGAGADITDRLGCGDSRFTHRFATFRRHARGRGFLDHLLVAALHRAVALEQVDRIGERVGEDLDFDVPGALDVLLDQDPIVTERGLGFALARCERGFEVAAGLDDAHAFAAAAGTRFDQHRISDRVRLRTQERVRLLPAVVARNQRHLGALHQRLGLALAPHRMDRESWRPDEHNPRVGARLRERLILGEEAVARVNRLGTGVPRGLQDEVAAQVALARGRRPEAHRLVGERHMQAAGIRVGVHGHSAHAESPSGRVDAAGDLPAIGNQDLPKHGQFAQKSPDAAHRERRRRRSR